MEVAVARYVEFRILIELECYPAQDGVLERSGEEVGFPVLAVVPLVQGKLARIFQVQSNFIKPKLFHPLIVPGVHPPDDKGEEVRGPPAVVGFPSPFP